MHDQLRLPFVGANTLFEHFDDAVNIQSFGNILDYTESNTTYVPEKDVVDRLVHPPHSRAWCVLVQPFAPDFFRHGHIFRIKRFQGSKKHHDSFVVDTTKRCGGVILDNPMDAVAVISYGDPILVLHKKTGGAVAVLNCSNASLNREKNVRKMSVLDGALRTLGPAFYEAPDLSATLIVERAQYGDVSSPHTVVDHTLAERIATVAAQIGTYGVQKPDVVYKNTYIGKETNADTNQNCHHLTFVLRLR